MTVIFFLFCRFIFFLFWFVYFFWVGGEWAEKAMELLWGVKAEAVWESGERRSICFNGEKEKIRRRHLCMISTECFVCPERTLCDNNYPPSVAPLFKVFGCLVTHFLLLNATVGILPLFSGWRGSLWAPRNPVPCPFCFTTKKQYRQDAEIKRVPFFTSQSVCAEDAEVK